MKGLFTFIGILFFTIAAFAQTTLEVVKQPLPPEIAGMSNTFFLNPDTGWVVGNNSVILKTEDGGNSGEMQTPDGVADTTLYDVFFVNDTTGWVVGKKGLIWKTTDGGATWTSQTSDSSSSTLYCVYAVDEDTVFIGGSKGAILKTTDGGNIWVNQSSGTTKSIKFIYAFSGLKALATPISTKTNDALFTEDGGITWQTATVPISPAAISQGFKAMHAAKNGTAYISSWSGGVYKSTDFGHTWTNVALLYPGPTNFSVIKTTDGEHVWTGGTNGMLCYSADGGASWDTLNYATNESLKRIHVFDDNTFILVTSDQWFITENNGKTYSSFTYWTNGNLNSIAADGNTLIVTDYLAGNISVSHDAGETWSEVSHRTNAMGNLRNVLVVGDTALYVGNDGQIGLSLDAGETWTMTNDSAEYSLYALGYLRDLEGGLYIAGGEDGIFFISGDPTRGWETEFTGFDNTISDIYANEHAGYGVFTGLKGRIMRSAFEGSFVSAFYDSNKTDMNSIAFINDSIGYVVGGDGLLLKTSDAGNSWAIVDTLGLEPLKTSPPDLNDIQFIDSTRGFICGWKSVLYETTDGGETWTRINVPEELEGITFYKMAWISNTECYISAGNGRIVKLTITPPDAIDNEGMKVADKFELEQNYPNPFNPATTIKYSISQNVPVKITVFNTAGQKVATLIDKKQQAGNYTLTFNGSNLASGVYFYKIKAGDFVRTRKMLLIK